VAGINVSGHMCLLLNDEVQRNTFMDRREGLMPDFAAIKARQQQTWTTGDHAMISHNVMLVSELLCQAIDLRTGQRVLDVATGRGPQCQTGAGVWARSVTS
jgi:protein-L-isoaspartate O-methyltransferase